MDDALVERVRSAVEEVFNDRDLTRINDETFSPEFVNRNAVPGTPAGAEGQRQVMQVISGIPATGKTVRWRQCHLLTVDERGRFVEHDAIRDDLGLLRQLGVMPGAAGG